MFPQTTVRLYPFQIHSIALSSFASIMGPFGGFFASGFKRAFKIKVWMWTNRNYSPHIRWMWPMIIKQCLCFLSHCDTSFWAIFGKERRTYHRVGSERDTERISKAFKNTHTECHVCCSFKLVCHLSGFCKHHPRSRRHYGQI